MNSKGKGARGERRAIAILEAAGYVCTKASASLGIFDVIAIGPSDVRCIQVKVNEYLSAVEREQILGLRVAPNVTREYWRFVDGKPSEPRIEIL